MTHKQTEDATCGSSVRQARLPSSRDDIANLGLCRYTKAPEKVGVTVEGFQDDKVIAWSSAIWDPPIS